MCMLKEKTKKTFNIENEILEKIKLISKNKGVSQTEIINTTLKQGLLVREQKEKQEKTKGDNFIKLAGIVTSPEPFDATKEVKKFRSGEL